MDENDDFEKVLLEIAKLFPTLENDMTLRSAIDKLPALYQNPEPQDIKKLFIELDNLMARLSPQAMSEQEKFLVLLRKLHPRMYADIRADRFYKHRSETFTDLRKAIIKVLETKNWVGEHEEFRGTTRFVKVARVETKDDTSFHI
eukprot:EG_transcript_19051